MTEIEINRHYELVHPFEELWGWEIALYLFLGGLVAGLMVFGGIIPKRTGEGQPSRWVRWIPFAPPILISIGMFLLFLDLEFKSHVYRFYLTFELRSPMSWGAWLLVLLYPSTILQGMGGLTKTEVDKMAAWRPVQALRFGKIVRTLHQWGHDHLSTVTKINIGIGVALGLYTGILLGTLQARALWNSTMLAPLFLASGFSTGAALLLLFPLKSHEKHLLVRWDLYVIGAEVILLALFFIDRATSCVLGREQVSRFFGGDLTAPFWSLVIVAGLAVPALLEALHIRRGYRSTIMAPLLILLGGVALRWILVAAGQTTPLGV